MKPDTLEKLEANRLAFPACFANAGVDCQELDAAEKLLGVPFSPSYREFVMRFGGATAGSLSVAGLKRWEYADDLTWSIVIYTDWFRSQAWPGTDRWAVFSDDGFGNPVGLAADGHVWLSDHNCCECVCIEADFEDWLRSWSLGIEPVLANGYLARWKWPS